MEAALRRRWVRLRHRGDAVECPCCGRRWGAFAADWNRPDAVCPGCGAHERHRALWLHLRDQVGTGPLRMLHFAPEHALSRRLEKVPGLERVTADLDGAGVDVAADITALPFEDGSFGAAICSHVLEHVQDDRAAMAELRRVLRPGGWAAVLVPVDLDRAETYEDPAIVQPPERERAFWQHDHVRVYALDIAERLRAAGFAVELVRVGDRWPPETVERHGLLAEERIFHCVASPP